jgi:hypothetical protein
MKWGVGLWTGSIWLRIDRWRALVNTVMNLRVPYNAGNFLTSFKPVSFSTRTLLHGVSKYIFSRSQLKRNLKSGSHIHKYPDADLSHRTGNQVTCVIVLSPISPSGRQLSCTVSPVLSTISLSTNLRRSTPYTQRTTIFS